MSNYDGTLMVGDGSDAPVDVQDNSGYKIENDPFLYVFNIKNGTQHRIARHDTSWQVFEGDRQVTHPHPSLRLMISRSCLRQTSTASPHYIW